MTAGESGRVGDRTGGGRRIATAKLLDAWRLSKEGMSAHSIAKELGVTYGAIKNFLEGDPRSSGYPLYLELTNNDVPGPIPHHLLERPAAEALNDFRLFRERYHGRVVLPWHEDAAYRLTSLWEEANRSLEVAFVVVNVFPGSGKTVLIRDMLEWWICRNRAIRALVGSATHTMAASMTEVIRRDLERITPNQAPLRLLQQGLATDAKAALCKEYGRFEPKEAGEMWTRDRFFVEQIERQTSEKEATVTAYGLGAQFLGARMDVGVWDDVQTKSRGLSTAEARQKVREQWDDEVETRIEPGGILINVQQRLHPEDLSQYLRDKKDWSEAEVVNVEPTERKMYHHIIYPAHHDDVCKGQHTTKAKPWAPDGSGGCLLDPVRGSYQRLMTAKGKDQSRYQLLYQQQDTDLASHPIKSVFITGGTGVDGVDYPGCVNESRGICELPEGISREFVSVATVDPSPTKRWAVQWWVYHRPSQMRFLMDMFNQVAEASELIDFNPVNQQYYGIMEDWQNRSEKLGIPITHWVYEKNAAQRFMLQLAFVKAWLRMRNVRLIPHETTSNKLDPDRGIEALLPPLYARGMVDIPAKGEARARVYMPLRRELEGWPEVTYDDCVMAQWFFEYHLPRLQPIEDGDDSPWRPSWVMNEGWV